MSEKYWKENYNTPLTGENPQRFQNWLALQKVKRGRDLSGDLTNYDMQGYWLNGGYKDSGAGHMPDTYKKPNHPSFSNESQYSGKEDLWGGKFEGGRWVGDDKTGWSYQASARMLKTTHTRDMLQQYFADNEPDVMLLMPTVNAR
jgi:hypothetical protein